MVDTYNPLGRLGWRPLWPPIAKSRWKGRKKKERKRGRKGEKEGKKKMRKGKKGEREVKKGKKTTEITDPMQRPCLACMKC